MACIAFDCVHAFMTDAIARQAHNTLQRAAQGTRVGIYTSFGPSIPVYTCIYTDTRIYGLNTYDD